MITSRFQVVENDSEIGIEKNCWDVLKEERIRADELDAFKGFRPEVALIFFAESFSSRGEWLTWGRGSNDINHTSISFGVPLINECLHRAEDWGVVEPPVPDSLGNDPLTVVVIFHIPHRPPPEPLELKGGEAGAGEEAEVVPSAHLAPSNFNSCAISAISELTPVANLFINSGSTSIVGGMYTNPGLHCPSM